MVIIAMVNIATTVPAAVKSVKQVIHALNAMADIQRVRMAIARHAMLEHGAMVL